MPLMLGTERMFGTGGCFRYAVCPLCESLCLQNQPDDLSVYYPTDYYAYEMSPCKPVKSWLSAAKRVLCHHFYQRFNPLLAPAGLFFPKHVPWIPRGAVGFHDPILDIGCGGGRYLDLLAHDGFTDLTGIDPFIAESFESSRFKVLKRELAAHEGRYKLIFSHHVIEHVPDPIEFLGHVERLLKPGGLGIICTPNPVSLAARYYKQFWFALDPPRHLNLISPRAFQSAAARVGLRVERFCCNSEPVQFAGSRSYQKGLKMLELEHPVGVEKVFFRTLSTLLNKTGYGDAACYLLRRS